MEGVQAEEDGQLRKWRRLAGETGRGGVRETKRREPFRDTVPGPREGVAMEKLGHNHYMWPMEAWLTRCRWAKPD